MKKNRKPPTWYPPLLSIDEIYRIRMQIERAAPISPAWFPMQEGLPAHAIDGPSAFDRVLTCLGSVLFCKHKSSPDTQYSYEGSVAHELVEICFKEKRNPIDYLNKTLIPKPDHLTEVRVDMEMVDSAEHFLRYCKAIPGELRFAENVIDLRYWARDCFGSCDFLIADIERKILHVIDKKYGKGVPVNAATTAQPLGYALGAIWALAEQHGTDWIEIHCHIIQNRLDNCSEVVYTMQEVISFGEHAANKLKDARDPNFLEFKPGLKQCQFCAGKNDCDARARHFSNLYRESVQSLPNIGTINDLSPADMQRCIEQSDGAVRFFNGLEKAALQRALDGTPVPGHKLVRGIQSKFWTDQEKAEQGIRDAYASKSIELEPFKPRELKSPNTVEQEIGKKAFKEFCAVHMDKSEGRLTLVKDTDPREEVVRENRFQKYVTVNE